MRDTVLLTVANCYNEFPIYEVFSFSYAFPIPALYAYVQFANDS